MLGKLKSIFVLKKIFKNIANRIFYDLIRYNNKYKKKFDLCLNDYKTFKEIVVEIIPTNIIFNKTNFININKEYIKSIYFNDEEVKRNYLTTKDLISKIKIILEPKNKSLKQLFHCCDCIKEINFVKFDRSDITDMSEMFNNCKNLININFTKFNTSNVKNMKSMFSWCSSLKKLELSNFNTSNVLDMCFMFLRCFDLKYLNVL